jgi:GntR family transcriptional regulator
MIDLIQARVAAAESAPGPKYQVLRAAIVDAIARGDWTPGVRLPTEVELASVLPFSLGTIQKAYDQLVQDGLVVRARRRGSFVAPIRKQMAEPLHVRFLGDDGAVLPVYPRLTGHAPADPDPRWATLFGANVAIVRIDRMLSINEEFEVFSRFFCPDAMAKPLLRALRRREAVNLKVVLLRDLGMPISRLVHTIAQVRKHPRKRGASARTHLLMEATAYTAKGQIAYFQEFHIPPNGRRLLFDSSLRP